jgi:hypothetical protein
MSENQNCSVNNVPNSLVLILIVCHRQVYRHDLDIKHSVVRRCKDCIIKLRSVMHNKSKEYIDHHNN